MTNKSSPGRATCSCFIRANSGAGIGLGHVRRCLGLALELEKLGCCVQFLEPRGSASSDVIKQAGLDVVQCADSELSICQSATEADILLIDHYDLNITRIARCSPRPWKLAVFEDMGTRKIPVDLAINGSPSAYTMNLSGLGARRVLAGPDYQIIRSDLRSLASTRCKKTTPTECLITHDFKISYRFCSMSV